MNAQPDTQTSAPLPVTVEPDAPVEDAAPAPARPTKGGQNRPRPVTSSLDPIKPAAWGYDQARHLLWRAGFGGTPEQIRLLVSWGPEKSVDALVDFDKTPFEPDAPGAFDKDLMRPATREERGDLERARRAGDEEAVARLRARREEAQRRDREQIKKMQRWWLERMIETPRPLEEKMTLFWHGHFATSYRTIEDSYHSYQQNRLFREHALGNFGEMLYAIIRDPAMIAYLDNNDSRKGRPNENLARELMELFSLGVGNYSEKDIKEGARALTGYTFEDDDFEFRANNHDAGTKTILGKTGTLDGDGFVAAILAQPACAKFMADKLYRFFVADFPSGNKALDDAAKSVTAQMATQFRGMRYELKPVMRRLLLSQHFYDPRVMRQQIKSPAELVVGMVRQLGTPVRDLGVLADAMNMMGQSLFFPPSVKGWNGSRSWINTATLFIRQNIACFLLTGRTPSGFDPLAKAERYDAGTLLEQLGASGGGGPGGAETIQELLRFCLGAATSQNAGVLADFVARNGGTWTPDLLTQALTLVTAMPEYQLC